MTDSATLPRNRRQGRGDTQQRVPADRSRLGEGLKTDEQPVVIVKLTIPKRHLPKGVHILSYEEVQAKDARHKARAAELGLGGKAALGRWRTGRVDTGELVLKLEGVAECPSFLKTAIEKSAPALTDIFAQERRDGLFTISFVFMKSMADDETVLDIDDIAEELLALTQLRFGSVFIWDNQATESPATINFSKPIKGDGPATGQLSYMDGHLTAA